MATITAASRKPLRAAGASARAGAGWVDTFAVRTEPFIGKCLNLSANAAGEQSLGTTRPSRGTTRPDQLSASPPSPDARQSTAHSERVFSAVVRQNSIQRLRSSRMTRCDRRTWRFVRRTYRHLDRTLLRPVQPA